MPVGNPLNCWTKSIFNWIMDLCFSCCQMTKHQPRFVTNAMCCTKPNIPSNLSTKVFHLPWCSDVWRIGVFLMIRPIGGFGPIAMKTQWRKFKDIWKKKKMNTNRSMHVPVWMWFRRLHTTFVNSFIRCECIWLVTDMQMTERVPLINKTKNTRRTSPLVR